MAAELSLLSLTQIQKLSRSQNKQELINPNPSSPTRSLMWNPKQSAAQDDEDSWEVRAFEQDTGSIMGTTWPPRSYTCTFCRREFRSAQALGGHMNIHRRDRAKLHQVQPPGSSSTSSPTTAASSTLLIPAAQECIANGGLCLLYSLPNPNGTVFSPTSVNNACLGHPSTLLSISPYSTNNINPNFRPPPMNHFPVALPQSTSSSLCQSTNTEPSISVPNDNNHNSTSEELDLELRLGPGSSPPKKP